MNRLSRISMTFLLGLALFTPGCTYVKDRVLDMSDVVDIKYGYAAGAGVKVEATNYLGVGVGWALQPYTREWYGRRSIVGYHHEFLQFVLAGRDGTKRSWGEPTQNGTDFYNIVLPINISALDHDTPPMLERWRFGFEILIPTANGGLYLNLGELLDFVLGLATIDIADDDGIPKSAQYNENFALDEEPEAEEF